ncbi:hypothetical protein EGI05_01090 [Chryseobacterium daecheongense]|uniref:Uncharacterized protein n=1 Tax=Chryseobacterium daecheongense TaxID=192389 RepID=A0A3N0W378_9FLAO|nr:hypothetical protein EGI05_01090 [Chryseobacterium daecheongense]
MTIFFSPNQEFNPSLFRLKFLSRNILKENEEKKLKKRKKESLLKMSVAFCQGFWKIFFAYIFIRKKIF